MPNGDLSENKLISTQNQKTKKTFALKNPINNSELAYQDFITKRSQINKPFVS